MSSNSGECFVVLPPFTESNEVIYGRNSYRPDGEVSEVVYANDKEKSIIISKPFGIDGAESGANNSNVSIGITWTDGESLNESYDSTTLTRMALETSASAVDAVDKIADFIEKNHSCNKPDMPKYGFVICDTKEVWILNVAGKNWAAEVITDGFRHIPQGLSISTKIDKSSPNLQQTAQDLTLWDGSGEFNFREVFGSSIQSATTWPGKEPSAEVKFSVIDMFKTLRTVESDKPAQSSNVSQLSPSGVSCHWFTATPNPNESVFKPFVFTPNARISPLTVVPADGTTTLLHKLYQQRNWEAVGSLLRSLEDACVDEMTRTLGEMGSIGNSEFDELLKDCVEAEVKFYR